MTEEDVAKVFENATPSHEDDFPAGRNRKSPPQRDQIVGLIDDVELWHTPDGDPFATVIREGATEHLGIRFKPFRNLLFARYFESFTGAPSSQAIEDALKAIEARAVYAGKKYPLWRRTARQDGVIFIDIADDDRNVVEVTSSGWRVIQSNQIKFFRSSQMRPLPYPEPGGAIEDIREYVNLSSDADFRLMITWLLAALRPTGPYPILVIGGEQGSAKSTATKVLRSLVDPNAAPVRSAPREERELFISTFHSWMLAFDNLSGIPGWLSDTLCRIATGGGVAFRQLTTDREEIVFEATRPVIMNGIPNLANNSDLADRSITMTLAPIPKEMRRTERDFWDAFSKDGPFLFGSLLTALSGALSAQPDVNLTSFPRMADFAEWAVAIEMALEWPEGSFMEAYSAKNEESVHAAIESDLIAQAILALAAKGPWDGSATELLESLNASVPETTRNNRSWPKTAGGLGSKIMRAKPALRALGVVVDRGRSAHSRNYQIYDTREPSQPNTGNSND